MYVEDGCQRNNRNIMKTKLTFTAAAVTALALLAGCATSAERQAELQKEARISKDDAAKTALSHAPNGTIKESELEREHGKLIWSFGIATPDSTYITEVNINAVDGSLVNIEKESPDQEAKEKD